MGNTLSNSEKNSIGSSASILALVEILAKNGLIDYKEFSELKEKYKQEITEELLKEQK